MKRACKLPGTTPDLYDMVEEWRAMTNLPAVLAVWAGQPEVVTEEVVRDFQTSLEFGMQHLDEISEEAAEADEFACGGIEALFDREHRLSSGWRESARTAALF